MTPTNTVRLVYFDHPKHGHYCTQPEWWTERTGYRTVKGGFRSHKEAFAWLEQSKGK